MLTKWVYYFFTLAFNPGYQNFKRPSGYLLHYIYQSFEGFCFKHGNPPFLFIKNF